MSNQTDFLFFSDEQESVQKRTFTKWINTHLAKVIYGFEFYFFFRSNLFIYAYAGPGVYNMSDVSEQNGINLKRDPHYLYTVEDESISA